MVMYKIIESGRIVTHYTIRNLFTKVDGNLIVLPIDHNNWSDATLAKLGIERVEVPSE